MPVIIIFKSDQFHSNYRKIPSDHVRTLNEKLDLISYYQKFEHKNKMTDQFLGSLFQFHRYDAMKPKKSYKFRLPKSQWTGEYLKNQPPFLKLHYNRAFSLLSVKLSKKIMKLR